MVGTGLNNKLYDRNEKSWHKVTIEDLAGDRFDYVRGFFCGGRPENSFEIKTDYHGVSIPFKTVSFDEIINSNNYFPQSINIRYFNILPFKVYGIKGLCDKDIISVDQKKDALSSPYNEVICPVSFDDENKIYALKNKKTLLFACLNEQHHMRSQVLTTGKIKNKNFKNIFRDKYFNALIKLIKNYELLRLSLTHRYEDSVQDIILRNIYREKVESNDGEIIFSGSPKKKVYDFSVKNIHHHDYHLYLENDLETFSWNGVVPSLTQEKAYYESVDIPKSKKIKNVISNLLISVDIEKKYAEKIIDFFKERKVKGKERRTLSYSLVMRIGPLSHLFIKALF